MRAAVSAILFRLKKPRLASALMLFLMHFPAGCATVTPPPQPSPTITQSITQSITVVGNGNLRIQANIAQVSLGIEVVDESVLTASRRADEIMQRVLDALASQSIAGDDVRPFAYHIYAERYYPGYEIDDPGTVPLFPEADEEIRYRVIHQLHVAIHDFDSVPTVVGAAVAAGGKNLHIYGTDYLYDEPEELEAAAREKAIEDARGKAEEIAQLTGVELGPVTAISELIQGSGQLWDNNYFPPLWPGQLQFYLQLQVSYATK